MTSLSKLATILLRNIKQIAIYLLNYTARQNLCHISKALLLDVNETFSQKNDLKLFYNFSNICF